MGLVEDRDPWLRFDFSGRLASVWPTEAVKLRDGLRKHGGEVEERLARLIDAKATELLASPLYVGTVSLRIDRAEEAALLSLLAGWKDEGAVHELMRGNLWKLWAELG